jgi:hypothetical protein
MLHRVHSVVSYLSVILFLAVLAACSKDNSGGDDGEQPVTPAGNGAAAVAAPVDVNNARKFLSLIYGDSTLATSIAFNDPTARGLRQLARRQVSGVKAFSRGAVAYGTAALRQSQRAIDGTKTVTGELGADGTGVITTDYANYQTEDGVILNGRVIVNVRAYDQEHDVVTDALVTFVKFSVKYPGLDETLDGTARSTASYNDRTETLTLNLDGRDNLTAKTFRFENFVTTTQYEYELYLFYGLVTDELKGRIHLGDHGYVDVTTSNPIKLYAADAFPHAGGPLVFRGARGSVARISPNINNTVRIEVDADGDGTFEVDRHYSWSDLGGDSVPSTVPPPVIPPPPTEPIVYGGATNAATITAANANRFFALLFSPPFDLDFVISSVTDAVYSVSGASPQTVNTTVTSGSGSMTVAGTTSGYMDFDVTATFSHFDNYASAALDGSVRVVSSTDGNRSLDINVLTYSTWNSSVSISGSVQFAAEAYTNNLKITTHLSGRDNLTGVDFKLENVVATLENAYSAPVESTTGRLFIGTEGYVDLATTTPLNYPGSWSDFPNGGGPLSLTGAAGSRAQLIPLDWNLARVNVDADGNGAYETGHAYYWGNLTGDPAPNEPPQVGVVLISPAPPHSSDTLVANISSYSDPNSDPLTLTYEWRKNGTRIAGQSGNSLASGQFAEGDVVSVVVSVSDGAQVVTATSPSVTILGPLPIITATPPANATHGEPLVFMVNATISNGAPITLSLLYGPTGMAIDATGKVTWTPREPMFESELDVRFGIRATAGDVYADYENMITVVDANRKAPLVRTSLRTPRRSNGLRVIDLDGDGIREIVMSDQLRVLSAWKHDPKDGQYREEWTYPFELAPDGYVNDIDVHDINADGRPDIIVGAGNTVVAIDGVSKKPIKTLTTTIRVQLSIRVRDVDNDGKPELVFIGADDTYSNIVGRIFVYDAATFALEWQSPTGSYGNSLDIGNVDGDAALEIVSANGYVIDGATKETQWNLGSSFGTQIGVGDLTGDGVAEIVGWNPSGSFTTRVYSGALKSPLWEIGSGYARSLLVRNVDGDAADEIIIDAGTTLAVYSYDATTKGPVNDWTRNFPSHSSSETVREIADTDNDGALEVVRTGDGYNGQVLAIHGNGASGGLEWRNDATGSDGNLYLSYLSGPFTGAHPITGNPNGANAFFIARDGASSTSWRLVTLDAANGQTTPGSVITRDSYYGDRHPTAFVDYDGDGVGEVFTFTAGFDYTTFSVFVHIVAYDPLTGTLEWSSERLSQTENPVAFAHADLNGDTHPDLVAITSDGYVYAFDVYASKRIWKSTRLPENCGGDVAVADLDGDGAVEIAALPCFDYIPTQKQVWIYRPDNIYGYVLRGQVAMSSGSHLVVGDVNNDGAGDLILAEALSNYSASWAEIRVVNGKSLAETSSYKITGGIHNLLFVSGTDAKTRIAVAMTRTASAHPYDSSQIVMLDAASGREIWRTPRLLGGVTRAAMSLVDVNADNAPEFIIGTSDAMYVTR